MNLIEHKKQVEQQALDLLINTKHKYTEIERGTGISMSWLMQFKGGRLSGEPKAEHLQALVDWFAANE